jgi:hypothetical protein
MKQLLSKIVQYTLIGTCALFLVLLFIPPNLKIKPVPKPKTDSGTKAASLLGEIFVDTEKLDPGDFAEMFGWIRPTVPPPPIPTAIPTKAPAATCIPAGYLKFISKFKDERDVLWWIFRDLRNNSTIKLNKATPDQGWSMISEMDTYFTFKKNGEIHCVPK